MLLHWRRDRKYMRSFDWLIASTHFVFVSLQNYYEWIKGFNCHFCNPISSHVLVKMHTAIHITIFIMITLGIVIKIKKFYYSLSLKHYIEIFLDEKEMLFQVKGINEYVVSKDGAACSCVIGPINKISYISRIYYYCIFAFW